MLIFFCAACFSKGDGWTIFLDRSDFQVETTTEEQKERIRRIILAEMEKAHALRKDRSLSREDKSRKIKALREEIAPKIKAILTPGQFEKWQKMAEERRARHHEK